MAPLEPQAVMAPVAVVAVQVQVLRFVAASLPPTHKDTNMLEAPVVVVVPAAVEERMETPELAVVRLSQYSSSAQAAVPTSQCSSTTRSKPEMAVMVAKVAAVATVVSVVPAAMVGLQTETLAGAEMTVVPVEMAAKVVQVVAVVAVPEDCPMLFMPLGLPLHKLGSAPTMT